MIELCSDPYPEMTIQARRDFAIITKTPTVERPYWFRDTGTGREYHGIYGAIGWPQKIVGTGDELPGYGVVVGVLKGKGEGEEAPFAVLAETEDKAPEILIQKCVTIRQQWGFGVHHSIMPVFYGDYRPFELIVADFNSRMVERTNERMAFVVSPPDDFEQGNVFDIYMGRLRAVLSTDTKRLYLNNAEVIKNRILAFQLDDPAIMALGGLVHVLLLRQPWLDQTTPAVWQLPEDF